MKKIPYGKQFIDQDDINAVSEVLASDYLTTGPKVEEFESLVSAKLGAAHAISCSSGTAGLHLVLLGLGLGPGDYVVVPAITFVATANVVRYVGADVIFCDVDPDSGLMTAETLLTALTDNADKNISAVITVHLNGQCTDMRKLASLCKQKKMVLIEDACHAMGSRLYAESAVGDCQYSDACVFSFHPVKTITSGEGGMLLTNNEQLAEKARGYRSHGICREAQDFQHIEASRDSQGQVNTWYYEMHDLGFNYRLSDINCSLGIAQFKKLDRFVASRKELMTYYQQEVASLSPLVRLVKSEAYSDTAWHLCVVLIDFDKLQFDKNRLMQALADFGILTQVHYQPVYAQPYYKKLYGSQFLAASENYYKQCLSLPLYVTLACDDVKYIVNKLSGILQNGHK